MPDNDPTNPGTSPGEALDALLADGRRLLGGTLGAIREVFTPPAGEPVACDVTVRIVLSTETSDNLAPEPSYVGKCRRCGKEYDVKVVVTPRD